MCKHLHKTHTWKLIDSFTEMWENWKMFRRFLSGWARVKDETLLTWLPWLLFKAEKQRDQMKTQSSWCFYLFISRGQKTTENVCVVVFTGLQIWWKQALLWLFDGRNFYRNLFRSLGTAFQSKETFSSLIPELYFYPSQKSLLELLSEVLTGQLKASRLLQNSSRQ